LRGGGGGIEKCNAWHYCVFFGPRYSL